MSKVVAGKEMSESVIEKMKQHELTQKKTTKTKSKESKKISEGVKKKGGNKVKAKSKSNEPKAGPSGINMLDPNTDLSSDYESETDEAKCCVCGKFEPDEVSKSDCLIFVKWAQCDAVINGHPCMHWVHLTYCTPTRVIRKGVEFFCPHCKQEE